MLDDWLIEDIDLPYNLSRIFNLKFNKDNKLIGSYTNHTQYFDQGGGYSDGYTRYFDYTVYSAYERGGDHVDYYNAYNNYNDSGGGETPECEYQCEINQYVKNFLGDFDYNNNTDIIILAEKYNEIISYINNAKEMINDAIDKDPQATEKGLVKLSFNLQTITISDIFFAETFNAINTAINNFIDGATNIIEKQKILDFITNTEFEIFKETLNKIKIPDKINKGAIEINNE